MTDRQMAEILVTLDNLWGGLDEGLEAGYRLLLADEDFDVVDAVVRELSREDRSFLPKAPEVAYRVDRLKRAQRTDTRIKGLLSRVREQLSRPEPKAALTGADQPPTPRSE